VSSQTSKITTARRSAAGAFAILAAGSVLAWSGAPASAAHVSTADLNHVDGPARTAPMCSDVASGAHSTAHVAHHQLGGHQLGGHPLVFRLSVHQSVVLRVPPINGQPLTIPSTNNRRHRRLLCVMSQERLADGTFVERLLPLARGEVQLLNGPQNFSALGGEIPVYNIYITIGPKTHHSSSHRAS
jgi:hypothetical protein